MKLTARLLPVWLILSLLLWIPTAFAQPAVASDLVVAVDSVGMTVSDMDRSVDFYSRVLSFEKVSDVELWGEPYEQLQGVFGAHLRITSLRPASGPAIEFLEYLDPRDGRPTPSDLRANDLAHWQTRLVTRGADSAAGTLRAEQTVFISPGVIPLPNDALGFAKGFLVRDPDGHAMQVVER
jgi:catechol 2,3-dioxygenase-like lactoylglutathione lyase family enzyme